MKLIPMQPFWSTAILFLDINIQDLMKRFLIICLSCISMLSCNKFEYCAVYKFDIKDTVADTKAVFLPDYSVVWEEGDEISFEIKLNKDDESTSNHMNRCEQEICGKMIYSNSAWKTYLEDNGASVEVDGVELKSIISNGNVTFRFEYRHSDMGITVWFNRVRFEEGPQTITVQIPGNK